MWMRVDRVNTAKAALSRHGSKFHRACVNVTNEYALLIQNEARQLVPVDTGRLRAAIRNRVNDREALVTALIGVGNEVGSDVEYAAEVEHGHGPRNVEWQPLYEWALRKAKGRAKIAHKIAGKTFWRLRRVGRKARPFLRPAYDKYRGRYPKAIAAAARGVK